MHPQRFTGWCSLWLGGIIGPYIFPNEEGYTVTVNDPRYQRLEPTEPVENIDIFEVWFQQDGASYHTSNVTLDVAKHKFGNWVI